MLKEKVLFLWHWWKVWVLAAWKTPFYFTSMCVVTKSLRKREDAPTVYLAVAWMQLSVAMYRWGPPRGLENRHLFQGNGNKSHILKRTGTKTKWETGNIHVLGNRGTSQFISGEQVSPWEGLIYKTFDPTERGMCSILMRHPILCK